VKSARSRFTATTYALVWTWSSAITRTMMLEVVPGVGVGYAGEAEPLATVVKAPEPCFTWIA